jgi:CRISPR-associated protein Cmr3
MSAKQWSFEPLDTWFFRESRPYGLVGGSELASLFPPPARTVAGAIRTLIGEHAQINWEKYKKGIAHHYKGINLRQQIGDADDFGQLRLTGPYLIYNEQRLYPVPGLLMEKENNLHYLQIGAPVHCDLGQKVQLPILTQPGAKPLENAWLTFQGLQNVLIGELPKPETIIRQNVLFENEPRLGIGRNNAQRITKEGLLYQTQHIRPYEQVKIGAIVQGIDKKLQPTSGQGRFGGEGRLAAIEVTAPPSTTKFNIPASGQNLLLILLTPADLGYDKTSSWLPSTEFQQTEDKNGNTVWQGTLNGVELTIISAVLGKSVREGGWDLQNERPRPVKSFVPAGSVWFCQVKNISLAIEKLQGFQIGNETALGRGELVAGIWK